MIISGENYPAITIDQVVEIVIKNTEANTPSMYLILDARPSEEYLKGHIINAEQFSPYCLSGRNYETRAMIEAKGAGAVVAVCGERYCGGDVVATLCQRGYNAALVRGDYGYWKKRYPQGLLTKKDKKEFDFEELRKQYAENRKPWIERSRLVRATASTQNRTVSKNKEQEKVKKKPWK